MEQKVRKKWLKEGDKNDKYFHYLANHRRRINYVKELIVNENSVKANDNMRKSVKSYFKRLYTKKFDQRPKLDDLLFNRLQDLDSIQLEAAFTEEEILSCLWDCNGEKIDQLALT